jgi:galactokinase
VSLMESSAVDRVSGSVREAYKAATGLETEHRVVVAGDGARLVR